MRNNVNFSERLTCSPSGDGGKNSNNFKCTRNDLAVKTLEAEYFSVKKHFEDMRG